MTDFTHHTPRLLTDEDAAADLAGVPRPNDLPSVGKEDARRLRWWPCRVDRSTQPPMYDYLQFAAGEEHVFRAPIRYITEADARRLVACWNACIGVDTELLKAGPAPFSALVSERDDLASRVRELEGALCQISDMTYDSWTNGAIAKQIADAALASKEHP